MKLEGRRERLNLRGHDSLQKLKRILSGTISQAAERYSLVSQKNTDTVEELAAGERFGKIVVGTFIVAC